MTALICRTLQRDITVIGAGVIGKLQRGFAREMLGLGESPIRPRFRNQRTLQRTETAFDRLLMLHPAESSPLGFVKK
ncbi:hypothetical protein [Paraburkholderia sp. BR14320]|uniref:hypothetical protein n=1 Tax=unclassified Paraburkholderia TaxID=2615204 RepID=UPI0034CE3B89